MSSKSRFTNIYFRNKFLKAIASYGRIPQQLATVVLSRSSDSKWSIICSSRVIYTLFIHVVSLLLTPCMSLVQQQGYHTHFRVYIAAFIFQLHAIILADCGCLFCSMVPQLIAVTIQLQLNSLLYHYMYYVCNNLIQCVIV